MLSLLKSLKRISTCAQDALCVIYNYVDQLCKKLQYMVILAEMMKLLLGKRQKNSLSDLGWLSLWTH